MTEIINMESTEYRAQRPFNLTAVKVQNAGKFGPIGPHLPWKSSVKRQVTCQDLPVPLINYS